MYKLRPYQIEASEKAIEHFRGHNTPSVIVLPTGAGKSLVIANLASIARGRVLVLAHVKELVEQNHQKYLSYDCDAGIYSAGLNRKDINNKVIFASIQSIANAPKEFFDGFNLVIIDECHRVSQDKESQYQAAVSLLRSSNSNLKVLGLTATPYRLGMGWIYNHHYKGILRTQEERFFKTCIYELPLRYMIKNNYLTLPILIDSPVACYDFSDLKIKNETGLYSLKEISNVLKDQKRITPAIIKNILDQSEDRKGVMIFTSSVSHAKEILTLLPKELSCIVTANTELAERGSIISRFKNLKLKFLVNVSVLTTGFDAPHVDLIAILRPTESVGLYQQIVGRGLRLYPEKENCLVLDYTGNCMDLYRPQITDKRVDVDSMPVEVDCPKCGMINDFWGIIDTDGDVVEHFGRKCQRGEFDSQNNFIPCDYLYRYKICPNCQSQNDISARACNTCNSVLIDIDKTLKEAMSLKDAHVLRVEHVDFEVEFDKKRNTDKLTIKYYDVDAQSVSESYFLDTKEQKMAFYHNFVRRQLKRPEIYFGVENAEDLVRRRALFRNPSFVIARKVKKFWVIREKIFN